MIFVSIAMIHNIIQKPVKVHARERASFQFDRNEKALINKPLMTVEVDTFEKGKYNEITTSVQNKRELAQHNFTQVVKESLEICAKHHDYFHLEVFDYIQIYYHGVVLLRVKNNGSNSGVSVSYNYL